VGLRIAFFDGVFKGSNYQALEASQQPNTYKKGGGGKKNFTRQKKSQLAIYIGITGKARSGKVKNFPGLGENPQ